MFVNAILSEKKIRDPSLPKLLPLLYSKIINEPHTTRNLTLNDPYGVDVSLNLNQSNQNAKQLTLIL